MAGKYEIQQSQPLHIENTLLDFGRQELNQNNAFKTYREMKLDGVVSGSISYIKAVLSKGGFKIDYRDDSTQEEKVVIDALNQSLEEMADYDIKRLMSNWLSMVDYGCSLNEVVLQRVNGKQVFKTISPIHISSVNKFQFKGGSLQKLKLNPAENDGLIENTDAKQKEVNGDKILFFRLEPDQDFPLGKSLLYGAYTSWKAKKIAEEYELIGIAKNLSGVLHVQIPTESLNKYITEPASEEAQYVQHLISQAELLHAGKGSYVLSPSDTDQHGQRLYDVKPIGGGTSNAANYNLSETITRYNQQILLSLQTMVLSMGQGGSGGSFSLADNSTYLMTLFIENIRAVINTEFKKAIKIAFKANGLSEKRIPNLKFDDIEPLDWDEFTKGWQRLLASGGVTATQGLEGWFREQGNAPKADYEKPLANSTQADESERVGDKEG